MAENIVSSLFGLTPPQVQQQQLAQERDLSVQYAQMSPFERANSSMYQAGSQLTGAGLGLMGMQEPQMQASKQAEEIQKKIDHSTPDGLMQGAAMFNQAGNPRMAFMYQQAAQAKQAELANISRTRAQEELALAQAEKARQPPKEEPGAKYSSALGKLVYERSQFPVGSEEYKTYTQMIQAEIAAKRAPSEKVAAAANIPKPLPPAALKLQDTAIESVNLASGISSNLNDLTNQIDTGQIDLGLMKNYIARGANLVGISTEQSRNLATMKATLEKIRNDSLRLNKGTQTEGDAVRAWNEIFENMNDKNLVRQRLAQITQINKSAVEFNKNRIDTIRANYGHGPLDITPFIQPSSITTPVVQPSQPTTQSGGWSIRRK